MVKSFTRGMAAVLMSTTGVGAIFLSPAAANAQPAQRSFNVPEQRLSSAILEFSRQANVMLVADPDVTKGRTANAVRGTLPVREALDRLLAKTGTRAVALPSGGYRIEAFALTNASAQGTPRPAPPPPRAEAPAPADADDEIVVIAARRPQKLLDTSMAISAISAERLADANATSTADLQTMVPSLQYGNNPGQNFVYVRGVGNNIFGAFSNNSVATYFDGVYVPRQSAAVQELFDVNVEVLRGPQATFYGRNATGGAILLSSIAPTDSFTASADLQYGNYNEQRYRAVVSGPIAGDVLTARLNILRHVDDGDNINLLTNKRLNAQDLWAARGTLQLRATDNLTVSLIGNYSLEDGSLGIAESIDPDSIAYRPVAQGGRGQPFDPDPRRAYRDVESVRRQEVYGGLLRIVWDGDFASLTSTSAYNRYVNGPSASDTDASSAPLLAFITQNEKTDFYSQDLLLTSKHAGPLQWLLGASAFEEKTDTYNEIATPVATSRLTGNTDVKGYAFYGQLSYEFDPQLKVEAGLRYSSETRKGFSQSPPAAAVRNKKTWNDTSPRFAINFKPDQRTLVYLSATRGFKSGAFDAQNAANTVEPETIWSYEAGLRMQPRSGITLGLTAFHYDYSNIQLFSGQIVNGRFTNVLQNAASANVDGIEAEADFRLGRGFTIGGALSWLDARYAPGTILTDSSRAGGFGQPAPSFDVSGNPMVLAPRWSSSAYIKKKFDLGNAGSLELYVDGAYRSRRYFTSFKDDTLSNGPSTQFNARATYSPAGERFYIGAFIRNATDELIAGFGTRTVPYGRTFNYSPGRRYGLVAGFRY